MISKTGMTQRIGRFFKNGGAEEIAAGLVAVERFLIDEIAGKAPDVFREDIIRLFQAGGKRLRPLLVLVCGILGDYNQEELVRAAACVETIHSASLVHDDIIDAAATRRGKPTIQARKGERFAGSVGDYLFARAFEVAVEGDNPQIIDILAQASLELSLGELDGQSYRYTGSITLEEYITLASRKTASLFQAACELGAIVSGAERADVEAARNYGYFIGLAFQLYDDILDVSGSEEVLGKPAGSDLAEGFMTLPYILSAQEDPELSHRIREFLQARGKNSESVAVLLREITERVFVEKAREFTRAIVFEAEAWLAKMSKVSVREALRGIGNYVVERYY